MHGGASRFPVLTVAVLCLYLLAALVAEAVRQSARLRDETPEYNRPRLELRYLPPLTRAVLEGEFTGRTVITPYARWAARFGVWPLVVACAACVLICALMAKRRTYLFK